tara:strand:- start:1294 stop:1590 length:297 start_codon:yes stop_codon:yes gene_type:complete
MKKLTSKLRQTFHSVTCAYEDAKAFELGLLTEQFNCGEDLNVYVGQYHSILKEGLTESNIVKVEFFKGRVMKDILLFSFDSYDTIQILSRIQKTLKTL